MNPALAHRAGGRNLRQNRADWFAAADGDRPIERIAKFRLRFVTELMINRRRDIGCCDFAVGRESSLGIGTAVNRPTADSATRHRQREDVPPVIASRPAIEPWRATELGHYHDQRFIEPAGLLEVRQLG